MKKKTQLETVKFENNVVTGIVSVRSVGEGEKFWHCTLEQDVAEGVRKVVHTTTLTAENAVDATMKYRKIIPAGISMTGVYTDTKAIIPESVNLDEPTSAVDESDHGINPEIAQ